MKNFYALCALALGLGLSAVGAHATVIPGRWIINGAEVKDAATGLIWRRCAEGQELVGNDCLGEAWTFSPLDAQAQAMSEADATGVAWRLPNIKELASLAELEAMLPAIDSSVFPNTPATYFWSSTPYALSKPSVAWGFWVTNFSYGGVGQQGHNLSYPIRLVRAGRN